MQAAEYCNRCGLSGHQSAHARSDGREWLGCDVAAHDFCRSRCVGGHRSADQRIRQRECVQEDRHGLAKISIRAAKSICCCLNSSKPTPRARSRSASWPARTAAAWSPVSLGYNVRAGILRMIKVRAMMRAANDIFCHSGIVTPHETVRRF